MLQSLSLSLIVNSTFLFLSCFGNPFHGFSDISLPSLCVDLSQTHCLSEAYQFSAGNKAGWVLTPPENYNDWAGSERFQVNDTLLFKYKKGLNSVLEVNKDDYSNCNTAKPILKMEDGNSVFKFDRSGPFYFISGIKSNCDKGQKMITVVLAVRTPKSSPPSYPAPAPGVSNPPAISPSLTPMSPGCLPTPNGSTPPTGKTTVDVGAPPLPPQGSFAPTLAPSLVLLAMGLLVLCV